MPEAGGVGVLLRVSGFHPCLLLHHLDKGGVVDKGEQKCQESCIVVLLVPLLRGLWNEMRRAGLSVNRRRKALERGAEETDLLASLHELV